MRRPLIAALTFALAAALAVPLAAAASDVVVVPPGNRSKAQPKVHAGAWALTFLGGGSFKSKYKKAYDLVGDNPKLVAKIKEVSSLYGIDPVHVVGAIVGEHTYNIDVVMSLQTYYVKALQYAGNRTLAFEHHGESAKDLFKRPQFAGCDETPSAYEIWDCRQTVWNDRFAGKVVGGRLFPPDRLHRVFFAPMYAGQTLGLGQLSPVAALMVTDLVHSRSGLPLLSIDNPSQIYEQIMNPDASLHYVAANVRVSIDLYRSIAGFDISQNPGITATLYNLGNVATRARALRAENEKRSESGKPPQYPQENFYGWLVNDREEELRMLL